MLICGDHPRHRFLINLLQKNMLLNSLIVQEREHFIPSLDSNYSKKVVDLHNLHFKKREEAELEIFSDFKVSFKNTLKIKGDQINEPTSHEFILSEKPDVVITYGCGILSSSTLKILPKQTWNIHGGLSPWFKGAIPHFWPSYFLKPQYTGVTIHYITSKIDAGEIIHQTPAILVKGDGLHKLSSRSLKKGFESVVELLKKYKSIGYLSSVRQKTTGKLWLKRDWKPEHLIIIYEKFSDKIVDMYLSKEIDQEIPKIYDNFKN